MNKTAIGALLATAALPGIAHAQSAPSPFTSATRYDAARRVVGTIAPDPDGDGSLRHAATRSTYDDGGRLIRVETGVLAAWQPETVAPKDWPMGPTGFTVLRQVDTDYDALDRKTIERLSSGGTTLTLTQQSYDTNGSPECTAVRMDPATFGAPPASACTLSVAEASTTPDKVDRVTRDVHDVAGQLLQVRRAVGTSLEQGYATYAYTPNGRRSDVIDAAGNRSHMVYDGFDRLSQLQFPSAATVPGFSDADPTTATSTAGAANAADHEDYGYDAEGNRTSLRKRDGRVLAFQFDALNRMTAKIVPDGCPTVGTGACPDSDRTRDVFYAYDVRGLQTAAHFDGQTGADAVLSTYDGFGRLTASTTAMGGTSLTIGYGYDADGDRTSIVHPDGTAFTFAFDGLDRLVGTSPTATGTQLASKSYDAAGFPATNFGGALAYGHDGAGRLSTLTIADATGGGRSNATTIAYNPADQIASEARSNDAYAYAGAANGGQAYSANGLNQYASVDGTAFAYDSNGDLTSDGTSSYGYDAENRLITASGQVALTYDPTGRLWQIASPQGGVTRFLYDGDRLAAEYDGSGAVTQRYVHATGEDTPELWFEGAGLGSANQLLADHQGSIVGVVRPNGGGVAVDAYDEYGTPAAGNVGRFGYTGQAWVPELGLWHYKARVYSSKLGRFLQTDPVGYDDQLNLYAYVENDPLNRSDPSGKQWVVPSWGTIGNGLAGVGTEIVGLGPEDPAADVGAAYFFRRAALSYAADVARAALAANVHYNETGKPPREKAKDRIARQQAEQAERKAARSGGAPDGKGSPQNNQAQNSQFDSVVKQMKLTQEQADTLHREISKGNLDRNQILERAKDLLK